LEQVEPPINHLPSVPPDRPLVIPHLHSNKTYLEPTLSSLCVWDWFFGIGFKRNEKGVAHREFIDLKWLPILTTLIISICACYYLDLYSAITI
jgi:hypothetical protein